jgi:ribonuclease HII
MISPDLSYEKKLWKAGFRLVAGLDEAGRGAWAGPVAAGAVILPVDTSILKTLYGVRDSKQMTPRQRSVWAVEIKSVARAWGVGMASNAEIDAMGILPATRLAMRRALEQLGCVPQQLLVDAVHLPEIPVPQKALIKGDVHVLSIAAASVLAKTTRDALMVALDAEYPGYGLAHHKGYGTAYHRAALEQLGASEIHRKSFRPVKDLRPIHS